MNVKILQLVFYIIFLVGVTVLFYFVSAPYISAIFLALITAVLFRPLNDRIHKKFKNRPNIASFVSVLTVILIISIPVIIIGNLLVQESANFYLDTKDEALTNGANYSLELVTSRVENFIESRLPGLDVDLARFLNVGPYAEKGLAWLTQNLASFFSSLVQLTLNAFLFVLCLFYLFRDGHRLVANVLEWSPLFDKYDTLILNKISTVINSVLRGQLLVGLIQGLLTGIGFWIFGVSNPVIWGTVAAVASLVPAIGTSLVNAPAIIYLMLTGNPLPALGLLIWAIVAVGLVDNIIGPYFINRGAKIHPFLILISVLGGLSFFGPIGFIAGPVVLSLLFALLELYPVIIQSKVGPGKS